MTPLDRATVERATSGRLLTAAAHRVIEVHEEVASTNDRAVALGAEGAPEGSIVVAARQTKGRGRHGRVWSSPPGGLYFSLVLRPDDAMLRRLPATLLAGLAAAVAIDIVAPQEGVQAELKWPNDVHLGGKKVCGILGELSRDARGPLLVLGVGLNVTTDPTDLPEELRGVATSIRAARGVAPSLEALLASFLEQFDALWDAVRRGGGATILSLASSRMPLLGKAVRVRLVDRILEGQAAGLNATGGLVIEHDGKREIVVAGEVEEVRAS